MLPENSSLFHPLYVKIGISAVDESGAKKNMTAEIGTKAFDEIKKEAQNYWEEQLEKIVIESNHCCNSR